MKDKKNYSLTYPKIVAAGFALIIILGSLLLMLPISSKQGGIDYIDALFTSVSATCITGLVPFDTFSNWSVFGQIVILCLIQIGGLGFITVLALFVNVFRKRLSLKYRILLKESIGSLHLSNVRVLVKTVIVFTVVCELAGAALLSVRFIPLAGFRRGVYMAVFTSVSAFCNAGFDLMGMFSPSSSLTTVNNDPVIILTISALIVLGGIGFIVWQDLKDKKFKIKTLSVHSKLVFCSTAVLLLCGMALFFLFEYNCTFKNMDLGTKLLNSFFCSVTPRTAGFNSVEIADMNPVSRMLTIVFMFIGGSSGSTAGGVKTTTVAVLVLCVIANIRNKNEITVFNNRITLDTVKKAVSVVVINLFEIFLGIIIISFSQSELSLADVVFECASAMGTVGITTGITSRLNIVSKLVIIILMYIGRLTSLIFALSFVVTKPKTTTKKPKGEFMVG
ncbi:MAG: Trk family potassium uptake protein [Eubacterium sp.]|jgi:trk system potassium uptake protein TrkH|nr:Trk family potassium uptake protein [Eubacterium sp.]